MSNFDWVDDREKEIEASRDKDYFRIEEGDNRFILLSHFAPLAQTYNPGTKKYEIAGPGEKEASIKGVCWIAQEDPIEGEEKTAWNVKEAKIPYVVVKAVRDLSTDNEWDFKLPFNHVLNLKATGAGTKEVVYSLQPSPKEIEIPAEVLSSLTDKKSPEDVVTGIKERGAKDEDSGKE